MRGRSARGRRRGGGGIKDKARKVHSASTITRALQRAAVRDSLRKPRKAQTLRVLLHERGVLIRPQILPEARDTERWISDLQAGSQLMCRIAAGGKCGTSGSDAQARMRVRVLPEQPFGEGQRLLISAQEEASVRRRRKT